MTSNNQSDAVYTNMDSSVDFMTKVILYDGKPGSMPPLGYKEHGELKTATASDMERMRPRFVVEKIRNEYHIHNQNDLYGVSRLVLRDASGTKFAAVTDIGLCLESDQFDESDEIEPGAIVTLLDFRILKLQSPMDKIEWNMIFLVHSLACEPPPVFGLPATNIFDPPKCWLDLNHEAINKVERTGAVLFMIPQQKIRTQLQDEQQAYGPAQLLPGEWIQDPVTRYDWLEEFPMPGNTMHHRCDCTSRYGFKVCVVIQVPPSSINKQVLLQLMKNRCVDDQHTAHLQNSNSLDGLRWGTKCYALHFWYTCNIFQLQYFPNAKWPPIPELPFCVKEAIYRECTFNSAQHQARHQETKQLLVKMTRGESLK